MTSSVTLANYTYGYNANGDLTSYEDNSGNSLTYGYDDADQLTSTTGSLASQSYTFTYNYDDNGNRTSTSTDVGGTLTSATYSTDAGNELTDDGTYDYTYDDNGNTLTQTETATGSVTYYTWDYENRLTEVVQKRRRHGAERRDVHLRRVRQPYRRVAEWHAAIVHGVRWFQSVHAIQRERDIDRARPDEPERLEPVLRPG